MKENAIDLAKRLHGIIDLAIDGIITMDSHGIVESINMSAAKLFGYSKEEVVGNNINMLMPSPHREAHDGYLERYTKTRKARIVGIGREVVGLKKDGSSFPFRLAVSEVILDHKTIFTGVVHDLTEMKKAEIKIKQLNKELENKVNERTYELENVVNKLLATNTQLEKEIKERNIISEKLKKNEVVLTKSLEKEKEVNEMKTRFVSMASHEFRTPLASILSSASLIGRYELETQQVNREKHVKRIKTSVNNLTSILNDFLSISKLEEGMKKVKRESVDMMELCEEIKENTAVMMKPGQQLNQDFIGKPVVFFSDRGILRNVLFNLISNAIKYSNKDVQCVVIFENGLMIIKVIDQGIGIPEDDQKYLFQRFFRAGNVTNIQGTGLGLNIVKRYIDLLNGCITYQSKHEVGSTFEVTIPIILNE